MTSLSRAVRLLSASLALAAFAACGDPAAPEPTTTQNIEVTNVFAAAAGTGANLSRATLAVGDVQITRIRLTVLASPSGTNLFQQTYTVDPTATKWTLSFTAPVGETVRIVAELISVTAGVEKVEYSGQAGPLTISECTTACAPIPVKTYPGTTENLGATSVTLTPDAPTVVAGQTTNLTATVAPAGPTYTVAWKSLDPAIATVSTEGVVTGVAAGTARIEAAVASKADTVTVTVTPLNTCVETAYTVGSTTNGTWAAGDCVLPTSGRTYDMYAITLATQTSFTLQLTGPNGRRVQVRRAGTMDYVQVMASEAFMPAAVNPLQVGYVLPAGSYVMEVVTPDATTLGAYTLATTTTLPAGCTTLVYTWPGVTINGSLSNTDCTRPDGTGREDRYIVLPDAGVRLASTLSSTAFPVSLNLVDVQATPVLISYDRQVELGEPAKLAYTTTFAGYHNVVASHNNAAATGNYTLTISTESATNTCVAIETDLAAKMAKWESTDCAADGRLYDRYTFTTDEQTAFSLTLGGDIVGKTSGVYRNGVEILNWSNSSNTNDIKAAWVLEPGTYEFRAGVPTAGAGKTYTIVAADITSIGCSNNSTSGNVTLPGQTLAAGDCTFTDPGGSGTYFEDRLYLYLAAGKTIEVTMNGTTVAPRAIIRDPSAPPGTVLAMQSSATPSTVMTTFTTTAAGYYQVIFSSNAGGQSGAYSASIAIK